MVSPTVTYVTYRLLPNFILRIVPSLSEMFSYPPSTTPQMNLIVGVKVCFGFIIKFLHLVLLSFSRMFGWIAQSPFPKMLVFHNLNSNSTHNKKGYLKLLFYRKKKISMWPSKWG